MTSSNQFESNLNSSSNFKSESQYEIFLSIGKSLIKEQLDFEKNQTIEQCIHWIFENRTDLYGGENPNEYDFHIAKKSGEAKDDYPGLLISYGSLSENCNDWS